MKKAFEVVSSQDEHLDLIIDYLNKQRSTHKQLLKSHGISPVP